MADQFVGEIRIVPFNFAPQGWASCNGQILSIAQNTALFSLLGTNYGGNGTSNFGLPNLQGSVPIDQGNGLGLTPRDMGDTGGESGIAITTQTMPAHTHPVQGTSTVANTLAPGTSVIFGAPPGSARNPTKLYKSGAVTIPVTLDPSVISSVGGSQPHNNLQPYLVLNFVIALVGIFPSRA